MDKAKYIGMDVHKEAISIAVLNFSGKLAMECIIETKASTILQFFQGLSGSLHVTLEEGTWAAWLYDLLRPHVTELVVCNPRKNALLKQGSKSDRIDTRKLAELLRNRALSAVYHGENGLRQFVAKTQSFRDILELEMVRNGRAKQAKGFSFLTTQRTRWRCAVRARTGLPFHWAVPTGCFQHASLSDFGFAAEAWLSWFLLPNDQSG
jgi:hypothetical protein